MITAASSTHLQINEGSAARSRVSSERINQCTVALATADFSLRDLTGHRTELGSYDFSVLFGGRRARHVRGYGSATRGPSDGFLCKFGHWPTPCCVSHPTFEERGGVKPTEVRRRDLRSCFPLRTTGKSPCRYVPRVQSGLPLGWVAFHSSELNNVRVRHGIQADSDIPTPVFRYHRAPSTQKLSSRCTRHLPNPGQSIGNHETRLSSLMLMDGRLPPFSTWG